MKTSTTPRKYIFVGPLVNHNANQEHKNGMTTKKLRD